MPPRTSSSSTVRLLYPSFHIQVHLRFDASSETGLAEELFQQLTSSPAEPFLRGLQDLYVNFWGASDRPAPSQQ
jgi:hypothetical protein